MDSHQAEDDSGGQDVIVRSDKDEDDVGGDSDVEEVEEVAQEPSALEPLAVRAPEVVRAAHANHDTGGRSVDGHAVGDVVEELGSRKPSNTVRAEVSLAKLNDDPVLIQCRAVHQVFGLQEIVSRHWRTIRIRETYVGDERRARDVPLYAEKGKMSAQDEFDV